MGSIDTSGADDYVDTAGIRQPGIFGQMVFDSYTIVTLGFGINDSQRDLILQNLDEASHRLTAAFPFVGGQVKIQGRTTTNSGLYKIVPYPPHTAYSLVRRKDCTTLLSPYSEIVSAKAPFTLLSGDILSPMPGFGATVSPDIPWPVFIIQANLVTGGLLLTFASNHNALDMNGQGVLITHFATACNAAPFSPLDLKLGNENPTHPLLHPGETPIDLAIITRPSQLTAALPTPSPPPSYSWTYWRCPSSHLTDLKTTSSAYSTNDAFCAFYFQSLVSARISLGTVVPSTDEPIHFGRAANCRKAMGLTNAHMGHSVAHADSLLRSTDSLAHTASKLRETLGTIDGNWVRSVISHIDGTEDKTTIFYGGLHRMGKDLLVSSWAHHPLYNLEFGAKGSVGGLGKADFCRRPRMSVVPDLAYLMPRNREGDLDVAICLRGEEVEALKKVGGWVERMEYIG